MGDTKQAIEEYNKAIRVKQNFVWAYLDRGMAYEKMDQYQRAIEDYNAAISLEPDNADAYNYRGNAYLMIGNINLGCRDIQKACELGNCKALEIAKGKGLCR
jgi:tetratricopeptide (TPR) repeat protein